MQAVISGFGVCLPGNKNCEVLQQNLLENNSPLILHDFYGEDVYISKFSEQEFANIEQQYKNFALYGLDSEVLFVLQALEEALKNAKLDIQDLNKKDAHIVFASCQVNLIRSEKNAKYSAEQDYSGLTIADINATYYSLLPKIIANYLGIENCLISFSNACAASNNALGLAKQLVDLGTTSTVIVLSIDNFANLTTSGFISLNAQVAQRTSPFSQDIGLNLGEGACCVIVENIATLEYRFTSQEIDSMFCVAGYGLSSDAYHITTPNPSGEGAALAMCKALQDANLQATDIDYIKAHGTGTASNDIAESRAIFDIFQNITYVSSLKSFFGHTLGSSGLIEIIATILLSRKNVLPPNYTLQVKREDIANINLLPSSFVQQEINAFIANSFAFGGNNSSVVLLKANRITKDKQPNQYSSVQNKRIFINASSIFKLQDKNLLLDGKFKKFNRTSKQHKMLIKVAEEVLHEQVTDNLGVVAGLYYASQETDDLYKKSFIENPLNASAFYFPFTTLSTAAGSISQALNIQGTASTVLGSISAFNYATYLLHAGKEGSICVVSNDTTSEYFLQMREHLNLHQSLNFSDLSSAILLSSQAQENCVEVLAIHSLMSLENYSDNIYQKCFRALNVKKEDISLIVCDGKNLNTEIAKQEQNFLDLMQINTIRTTDLYGFGVASNFLNAICIACEQILITSQNKVLVISQDISGNAIATILQGRNNV